MSEQEEENGLELDIPRISDDTFQLILNPGDRVFVVGTNGSGKSALIQHIKAKSPGSYIERIPAHRRNWFHSDSVDITASDRSAYATNDLHQEMEDQARWTDIFAQERQSAVLFDLVDLENRRARTITRFVDIDDFDSAREASNTSESPFDKVNELLRVGTLAVSLEYSDREMIIARNQSASGSYGMSQMSDGERSAVSIAARVLTVVPGTILLIDEPERHLHPSISEPFLSALFECRKDCAFVVLTNDIALPVANREARVLLIRSCRWSGSRAVAWDIELLEANTNFPEDLKRAILGARKRILFVEGDDSGSLDLPLYSALFPDISVVPKGSCAEVINAVNGVRGSVDLHRVEAFGLIDRDNLQDDDVDKLANTFVFALDVYSVEALYYCTDAISAVAQHQAKSLSPDADEMIESANEKALDALKNNGLAERMAARRCERHIRNSMLSKIPNWKSIEANPEATICASVPSPFPDELKLFRDLLADRKLDQLVSRYPLRESPVFDVIAKALQLTGRDTYEQTLRARLQVNENLAHSLRQRIKSLTDALGEETTPSPQTAS